MATYVIELCDAATGEIVEVLVVENDELSLFIFVPFHNVVPRHFLVIDLRHAPVPDRAKVGFSQHTERDFFARGSRRQYLHGNCHETEADRAFPNRTHSSGLDPRGDLSGQLVNNLVVIYPSGSVSRLVREPGVPIAVEKWIQHVVPALHAGTRESC